MKTKADFYYKLNSQGFPIPATLQRFDKKPLTAIWKKLTFQNVCCLPENKIPLKDCCPEPLVSFERWTDDYIEFYKNGGITSIYTISGDPSVERNFKLAIPRGTMDKIVFYNTAAHNNRPVYINGKEITVMATSAVFTLNNYDTTGIQSIAFGPDRP